MLDPHALACVLAGVCCSLLLVFLEASLVDTALVLPWTPVSPDEFFVAGDAGPRVGVRRALQCVALYAPARPMPRIAILASNSE
jgi:hypothetical protein